MTILIFLSTLFSNALFAFKKNQSKFIVIMTLGVICLLMGGAGPYYSSYNSSRDYQNYLFAYNSVNSGSPTSEYEFGFTLLMRLGNLVHLNFFQFRLIIIIVCLLLLYKFVIKRYAYNGNYVLLMYMIYPMIIDSEHLRNFIALTVLLIAIRFLEKQNARNQLKFALMILLASCFHLSFLVYLFLIFVNVKNKNWLVSAIVLISLAIMMVAVLNNNQIPFISSIFGLFSDDRMQVYLNSRTRLGYLIPVLLQMASIMMLYWSKKILIRKNEDKKEVFVPIIGMAEDTLLNEIEFVNLILWINVIGIIFFPLFILSLQFYRLVRNFLLLNIIVYSIVSYQFDRGSAYKSGFNLVVIANLLLWLFLTLTVTTTADRIIIPFFTQNVF